MATVLFHRDVCFRDIYNFSGGEVYNLQEALAVKFCDVQGVAVRVPVLIEGQIILENPAADLPLGKANVDPPKFIPPESEPEKEVVPYEMEHRGGPWYDVKDSLTGEAVNERALTKINAEALLNELSGETDSEESTGAASDD